jgi:hypothetical protein
VNVENVRREDWILGGLGLLLAIVLLFLPWFDVSVSLGPVSVSATSTATGAPDGWLGVLGAIAALAIVVDVAIERLSPQTVIPALGGSRASTRMILAGVAALFVALKFLFHIHFSLFGWGFYVAVVVTVALVYVALQARSTESLAPQAPSDPVVPPAAPVGPGGSSGPPTV